MKAACAVLLALSFTPSVLAQEAAPKSQLEPLRFFVGQWHGTTNGDPGEGAGNREYQFVLGGKFLQGKNKTVYPPQEKNPKGETHEDIGLFSYDSEQKRLVLRQFHVEGFVNEYVEQSRSPDGRTLTFATARIENIPPGWRARETYKFIGSDEFHEIFELAPPGKEFATYAESHWQRVK